MKIHVLFLHTCIYEPPHVKTNKIECAPSEDSDQPGHLPSLTRVFAVRMKKAWVLSYPMSAQRRPESSLGAHVSMLVCHEADYVVTISGKNCQLHVFNRLKSKTVQKHLSNIFFLL